MAENIDKFNLYVGRVFGTLYKTHPRKTTIKIIEIIDDDYTTTHAQVGLMLSNDSKEEVRTVIDTVDWLDANGFIQYNPGASRGYKDFAQTVLTEKGLALLKIPSSLEKGKNLGSVLSGLVEEGKKGVKEAVTGKIKSAIGAIITKPELMTQAIETFQNNTSSII